MAKTHRDLIVWSESIGLARDVYSETRSFPEEEVYGISAQMRRASISIASNVAAGAARGSRNEFIRSLSIARGSLIELETLLIVAGDVGFLAGDKETSLRKRVDHVARLLNGLTRALGRMSGR